MSETTTTLDSKRESALARLRKRRGSGREEMLYRLQAEELEHLQLVVRAFRSRKGIQDKEEPVEEGHEALPAEGEGLSPAVGQGSSGESLALELQRDEADGEGEGWLAEESGDPVQDELRRIARQKRRIANLHQQAAESVGRWKEIMEARAQEVLADEMPSSVAAVTPEDRRKMISDLLSVDFLQNTQHWLASAKGDPDLSSTPIDEVEEILRQTQYRQKVLKVLEGQNQRTLDAIELYLRNAKATASATE